MVVGAASANDLKNTVGMIAHPSQLYAESPKMTVPEKIVIYDKPNECESSIGLLNRGKQFGELIWGKGIMFGVFSDSHESSLPSRFACNNGLIINKWKLIEVHRRERIQFIQEKISPDLPNNGRGLSKILKDKLDICIKWNSSLFIEGRCEWMETVPDNKWGKNWHRRNNSGFSSFFTGPGSNLHFVNGLAQPASLKTENERLNNEHKELHDTDAHQGASLINKLPIIGRLLLFVLSLSGSLCLSFWGG